MSRRQRRNCGSDGIKGRFASEYGVMKTITAQPGTSIANSANRGSGTARWKTGAMLLLLASVGFFASGCYDDGYGYRSVRTGYYATYGGPSPYYGYDPYPYGYGYAPGYGPGIAVGVSSYRARSEYGRPYYGRQHYRRSGYHDRYDRRRDRRWDGRSYRGRDRERGRNWERRRSGDGRRTWEGRKERSQRRSGVRGTAPRRQPGAPVDTQPE